MNDKIYSRYERCEYPIHDVLVREMKVDLPLMDFDMVVLNHLRIAPSQL